MLNKKIVTVQSKHGFGLRTKESLEANEVVLRFEGTILEAARAAVLPDEYRDHCVQIAQDKYIHVIDDAKYINHSCESNCGIQGIDTIVAMSFIPAGNDVFYDYALTENSDWSIECTCQTPSCRKIIGSYDMLPSELKEKYHQYTSEWLLKK